MEASNSLSIKEITLPLGFTLGSVPILPLAIPIKKKRIPFVGRALKDELPQLYEGVRT